MPDTCPHCSAPLKGLGTYCWTCEKPTEPDAKRADPEPTEETGNMPIRLTIPWQALASSNTRNSRKGGKAHGWEYKRAKEAVRMHALDQVRGECPRIPEGAVRIALDFHGPDRRRRDESNLFKCLLDGLEGVCYADDWQVAEGAWRRREPDRDNPRVEVTVRVCPDGGGGVD